MSELKRCPFCGAVPQTQTNPEEDTFMYYIACCHCNLAGVKSYDKEIAIERWNHRVYPPEVQQAIERMKPKKVVCRHFNKYYGNEIGDCPNCLCTIEDESELNEHPHCKYCGQALDWRG